MKPAIFLEKDDALLEKQDAARGQPRIRMRPGAVDALLQLSGLGYEIVVTGHEPAVAAGTLPAGALDAISAHLDDLFLTHGFKLAGCYWCPHAAGGTVPDYAFACQCRKPEPGLLRMAAHDHDLDLSRSWVIGRDPDAIEAGQRAGCSTVLIAAEGDDNAASAPDFAVSDLLEAAARIMRESRSASTSPPRLEAH
jgi:histidinol-phosphate phosphatase family protein